MFKRILPFLLAIFAALPMVAANAYDFQVDGICYYVVLDGQVEVGPDHYYYGDGVAYYEGDIVIPSQVTKPETEENYTVVGIATRAFQDCDKLISVTLPQTVTYINSSAFLGCTRLTNVELSDAITKINASAFSGCSKLEKVKLPEELIEIGNEAFKGCSSLLEIIVPNKVTTLGQYAFRGCINLRSAVIGNSVSTVSTYYGNPALFEDCENLKKIFWLPTSKPSGFYQFEAVNYVSNNAYGAASDNLRIYPDLASMFEVEGVKYIPVLEDMTCVVADCNYYATPAEINIGTTVTFNRRELTVTSINAYSFYENENIDSVTIEGASPIEGYSFAENKNLKTLKIMSETDTIGDAAFMNCEKLSKIVCLATNPPVCGEEVFNGVKVLNCDLWVLDESLSLYMSTDPWMKFYVSGVETIVMDDANGPSTYFDLMGRPVANPGNGIFIRVQGGKAQKVRL